MRRSQQTSGPEIEWDEEDEAAADRAWERVDAQLRREEAEGTQPPDDDGLPNSETGSSEEKS